MKKVSKEAPYGIPSNRIKDNIKLGPLGPSINTPTQAFWSFSFKEKNDASVSGYTSHKDIRSFGLIGMLLPLILILSKNNKSFFYGNN